MISIIVPVFNEAEHINSMCQHLDIFSSSFAYELIFVDGGSTDGSRERLIQLGYQVVSSPPGRGQQLRRGVEASRGDILLFLHADTHFRECPLAMICREIKNGPFLVFRLRFTGCHPLMRLIAYGSNWRVKYRHVAFGDQGMTMTRECYNQLGGFRAIPLMEDYDLSLRAKSQGIRCRLLPMEIWTSPRRFLEGGILKTLWRMQMYQAMFRKGCPPEKIQKMYDKN